MWEFPSFQTLEGTRLTIKHHAQEDFSIQLASHLFTCLPIDLQGNIANKYCLLLKRMHLTCRVWVEFLNIGNGSRGGIYISCQNIKPLPLHDLFIGRDLLSVLLEQAWSQIYAQL